MRKAKVYYKNDVAGILTETDEGEYIFSYHKDHIVHRPEDFITFTMPVREAPYTDRQLFPFFEGLIPEGWLLNLATENWKLDRNDRMGLLLACCRDCIGAVSIMPYKEEDDGP